MLSAAYALAFIGLVDVARPIRNEVSEQSDLEDDINAKQPLHAEVKVANEGPQKELGGGRSVSFVAVFGFDKDPQRGHKFKRDTNEHYKPWADSILKLGMHGVVLHDPSVFSSSFIATASSPPYLTFHSVNLTAGGLYSDPARKSLTPADWRFVAMHDYLAENPDAYDYVLLTDSHDVEFRHDPLEYMKSLDKSGTHHYVFGQEEWRPWLPIDVKKPAVGENSAFGRLQPYWKDCFGKAMPDDVKYGRMTNCGILGGHVSVVLPFLSKMLEHYSQVPVQQRYLMCDMVVYLKTVMENYNDRFISGYPFHAKFKHHDPYEDAIIYHKTEIPNSGEVDEASLRDELPNNYTNSLANNN